MPSIHVCLVSAQPLPNLIPVIAYRPEKVHLLVSEKMKQQAVRLTSFLRRFGCKCVEHPIDPYSMVQVEEICHAILKQAEPDSIALNATGGTKISAFGAFAAFRQQGFPIFYFDPEKWRIAHLDSSGIPPQELAAEISVADYLAAHGMQTLESGGSDELLEGRIEMTGWLAKHLPESGLMPVLNAFAAEALDKGGFPWSKTFDKRFLTRFIPVLNKLASASILSWDAKTKIVTFHNSESARYIGGFWLEEYVFNVISSLGVHDVQRNVRVAWDASGITNEFDVVFTNHCRLYLVSCKTSKLAQEKQYKDKNPVYELDSLKDDAAGLFGKGILVSASPLGTELKKRADILQLITISAQDIGWLEMKLKVALQ